MKFINRALSHVEQWTAGVHLSRYPDVNIRRDNEYVQITEPIGRRRTPGSCAKDRTGKVKELVLGHDIQPIIETRK